MMVVNDMSAEITAYIQSQVAVWGEEYVDNLIDKGFAPVKTSAGWRWLFITDDKYASHVETLFATAS